MLLTHGFLRSTTAHPELIVIQHGPSSKTRFIWTRAGNFLGRHLKRLASQIAIREIGLHGVSWIFKLKTKFRDL